MGYVNKGGDPALIVANGAHGGAGRKAVTPEIAQMLVESLTSPVTAQAHDKLSDREMQTLVKIARATAVGHCRGTQNGQTEDGQARDARSSA